MATAGTVTIRLDGDSATLIRELNKANKAAKRAGQDIGKGLEQVKAAGRVAAAGIAIVGTALGVMVAQSLKANDTLAKTARKLGTTTEALQGLRFAAEQTGVKTNQLDLGIQRMTRRIAEAAKGTGEAKAALKELGIDAVAVSRLPVDQQFSRIAEAMKSVESQSDRIRLGFKLFDSEGVALINTLKVGADGLEAFKREAQALGIALDSFQTARIEQANDALNRGRQAVQGIVNKFTVALAPIIEVVANRFTEWVKSVNVSSEDIEKALGLVETPLKVIANTIHLITTAFAGLKAIALQVAAAIGSGWVPLINVVELWYQSILNALSFLAEQLSRLPGAFGQAGAAITQALGEASIGLKNMANNARAGVEELPAAAEKAAKDFADKLNEPLPTDSVKAWTDNFKREVAAAKASAFATGGADNLAGQGAGDGAGFDMAAAKAAQQELSEFILSKEQERYDMRRLIEEELLAAQFQSEEALLAKKQELATQLAEFEANAEIQKQEAIAAARGEEGGLTEAERAAIAASAQISAAQTIAKENEKAAKDVAQAWVKNGKLVQSAHAQTWKSAFNSFRSFASGSGKLAKAVFKVEKAYSIGKAIVSTWTGVAKALELPYPANIAAAAHTLAQGTTAIAAVKSAAPGGSGGGGAITAAGSSGSLPPSGAGGSGIEDFLSEDERAEKATSSVQVIVQGNLVADDEYVNSVLIPSIQDAVAERDVVLISAGSRNAEEIVERVV